MLQPKWRMACSRSDSVFNNLAKLRHIGRNIKESENNSSTHSVSYKNCIKLPKLKIQSFYGDVLLWRSFLGSIFNYDRQERRSFRHRKV